MSLNKNFYAPEDYEASVPRAWHDLSTKRSFTPQTGQLVPVYNRRMYPGDVFKISVGSLLQTINPLTYPLLDCFELRLEYYYCPLSNYYGWMDNNTRNSTIDLLEKRFKWSAVLFGYDDEDGLISQKGILGMGNLASKYEASDLIMSEAFPNIYLSSTWSQENSKYNPVYYAPGVTAETYFDFRSLFEDEAGHSNINEFIFKGSLFETLGLPAGMQSGVSDKYIGAFLFGEGTGFVCNIEPLLCYLDIWRTYHANLQYNIVPVAGKEMSGDSDVYDDYYDTSIWTNVSNLDALFSELRYKTTKLQYLEDLAFEYSSLSSDYKWKHDLAHYIKYCARPMGGYLPVQYRPDIWRNILSSNVGSVKSTVAVSQGRITIDSFRQSNKRQLSIDSLELSGGRYINLIKTIFGWRSKRQLDIPQLLACTTHLIDPSNITAMADSNGVNLGQMGAKVDKFYEAREVVVKSDVDGYVMICASIIPRISYGQGIEPNMCRCSFLDDYDPNYQRLGFQDVPRSYFSVFPDTSSAPDGINVTNANLDQVVGKLPAWIEETTDVNRTYGEFSSWGGLYSPMVLNRNYSKFDNVDGVNTDMGSSKLSSLFVNSPYVSLSDNRDIFAEYSAFVSPWSLHLGFNIKAKRPIGKRYRPNLE